MYGIFRDRGTGSGPEHDTSNLDCEIRSGIGRGTQETLKSIDLRLEAKMAFITGGGSTTAGYPAGYLSVMKRHS